jgi:hypothetical protein
MPAAPPRCADRDIRGDDDRVGAKLAARANKDCFLARNILLPSFLSTKRSRVVTVAAAGTLTLAAAISAAVVILPGSPPAAARLSAAPAAISAADFALAAQDHQLADEQAAHRQQLAAAREAAAKAAAHKAAAHKAAAREAAKRKAAEQAASAAAAQQAAQSAQATASATPTAEPTQPAATVSVPSGSAQQVAEQMLSSYGWSSSQFSCLQPLWALESGWSVTAENPSSGAYGIPQALPGSKMASAGADWQTDAATQIRWGLTYIQGLYGSPCGAWSHEQADGWY